MYTYLNDMRNSVVTTILNARVAEAIYVGGFGGKMHTQ